MHAPETVYETKVSDARWIAYDIPGNIGWIAYLACLAKSLSCGLSAFNTSALAPGVLMLLGIGELVGERFSRLDRVLPRHRLLRGFGALTTGGVCGMLVSAFGLARQEERKHAAVMLAGSALCSLFAGLLWHGYRKK